MEKKFTEFLNEVNVKDVLLKWFDLENGRIIQQVVKNFQLKSGDMDPLDSRKFSDLANKMTDILRKFVNDNT